MTAGDDVERELVERVAPLWSERRTSAALGLSPAELSALAARGGLLRLETSDRSALFPLWQFRSTPTGVEVCHEIRAMLVPLVNQDPWTVALVLVTPTADDELGGLAPVEAARDAWPVEELVGYAEALNAEWTAR